MCVSVISLSLSLIPISSLSLCQATLPLIWRREVSVFGEGGGKWGCHALGRGGPAKKKINGRVHKNFRNAGGITKNVEQAYVDADIGGTESKRHIAHIGFIAS
jgi:hypothetical protein